MADRSDKAVASPPPVIKVAIVEDQRQIREGLALLIGGTEGFCCAGSFGSMEEALHRLGSRSPDVVLVDIGLPGISGIEGIRLLKERHSKVLFLALTVYRDDQRILMPSVRGLAAIS
jgi:DNA-binding NarL/FixJ family response regulator